MKLTYDTIRAFLTDWGNGKFPSQRMGQAFVNTFNIECDHSTHDKGACLFYETNNKKAATAIWNVAKETYYAEI